MRLAASPFRPAQPSSRPAEHHADACLSEVELFALADGASATRSRDDIDRHIDRCDLCLELAITVLHGMHPERDGAGEREPRSVSVGTVLAGRYRIDGFVSRGGMGEVYLVQDLTLGRRLALKAVVATACDSPRAVDRLLREARLARRIAHPNVSRVFDIAVDEQPDHCPIHFYTMEYVDAGTLRSRLDQGPLAPRQVSSVAKQCLSALHAIHHAGVLHLDLKPENVLYREDAGTPHVTVIDFGLSRRLGSGARGVQPSSACFEGSAGYGAPEQTEGRMLGVETDLYALGIVLGEMLTGQLPCLTCADVEQTPSQRASRFDASLPPGWSLVISRCLQPARQDRYPSAAEMLSELDRLSALGLLGFGG
jgi:serine/threonine protein kinase